MSYTTLEDFGKLTLRLSVGVLLLLHGIAKLLNGVSGIEGMVAAQGLPAFFAWAVYIGEVIAPLFLILGVYTRLGGLLVVANMLVAIALAHMGHLTQLTGSGGWRLELQGLYLFGGLAIAMLGAGRYSVGGKGGRWN
ncbi:DoxX family protein [Pusillimonas sp. SM2304]|uniref:DoxX family protein n=1 Tax=Pusillimonas sp. SM2304 TaxID=3073241 RepID=UPI00287506B8|nr:DoxX family protein [Pusillimonas sp. SM2304]MDS1142479.1 DoxX family protein [Pusillimonas sp. SM2304]